MNKKLHVQICHCQITSNVMFVSLKLSKLYALNKIKIALKRPVSLKRAIFYLGIFD